MEKRQQIYRNIAQSRRIVVPASRKPIQHVPREELLATEKPKVVVSAAAKDLKPKLKTVEPKKATPKRTTIDSFSPQYEAVKKSIARKNAPQGRTSYEARDTRHETQGTNDAHHQQPVQNQSYTQQIYQQQHPQLQPVSAQSVHYHNHYYAQPAQLPQPVVQQPYPVPQPSHYQQALMVAQQQPNLPAPIQHQYPVPVGGAVSLPAVKKESAIKPYTDSVKGGVAKIKSKLPELKYKPSDIMRYAIVTFFVIMASYLAFDTWNTNQQIQSVVGGDSAAATNTSNGQHPASADVQNPPTVAGVAYPDYVVANDAARILTIPSINLTARISEVGLTGANKIDVPGDASFAGWYNGSARIGGVGAAFLTGHYNGVDAGGIFDNLNAIEYGAKITVEMGDGSKLNYEVVNIENTPIASVNMSRSLSPSEGVVEGLNIMTCQGTWSGAGFSHRLTVYSKRV